MAVYVWLSRRCRRMIRSYKITIAWMLLLLIIHSSIWLRNGSCPSECQKYNTRIQNSEYAIERDGGDKGAVFTSRPRRFRSGLDPLRWRDVPREKQGNLTVNNIEYGVNVVPSLTKSVEGNIWRPLKSYKNPCWVEKMPENPALLKPIILYSYQVQSVTNKRHVDVHKPRHKLPRERENVSKLLDYLPNVRTKRRESSVLFKKALFDRISDNHPWKMRCLPYVYLAGVTKSGTTDFFQYLSLHQDIVAPSIKEIHYWNVKRFPRQSLLYAREFEHLLTFDEYLDIFDAPAHQINTSTEQHNDSVWHPKMTIDGSVSMFWEGSAWTQVPGNKGLLAPRYTTAITLAHFQPQAKIILLLREPVDRVYSYYRMFSRGHLKRDPVAFHNKTLTILRLYEECLGSYSLTQCAYNTDIEKSDLTINIRGSLYAAFMPDWLRAFPRDQFCVIRSEDYFDNRKPILDDVVKFLDLAPFHDDLVPIMTDPNNKVFRRNRIRNPMLNTTRRMLERFFQPFNDDLERMLGQTFWRYT